jgi:RNA polymerase sigma-70 factor (ECF subfamily)
LNATQPAERVAPPDLSNPVSPASIASWRTRGPFLAFDVTARYRPAGLAPFSCHLPRRKNLTKIVDSAIFSVARPAAAAGHVLGDVWMTENAALDPWALATAVAQGDRIAEESLWQTYRPRLKRMVVSELDPRLSARVDPSDVVQETILEAHRRLPKCVHQPAIAFYPWLRAIAVDQIRAAHRTHLHTQARSVAVEVPNPGGLPDDSIDHFAERLLKQQEGCPVKQLLKEELRRCVRETLERLGYEDRRVLVLRLIEDMSTAETATVLGISEPAVRMRQLRALHRFAELLKALGESEVRP